MTRDRSDVDAIDIDLTAAIKVLRDELKPVDGTDVDTALCIVETFCALSLRVMRKTNPSKIRSEAATLEIKARWNGTQVLNLDRNPSP